MVSCLLSVRGLTTMIVSFGIVLRILPETPALLGRGPLQIGPGRPSCSVRDGLPGVNDPAPPLFRVQQETALFRSKEVSETTAAHKVAVIIDGGRLANEET